MKKLLTFLTLLTLFFTTAGAETVTVTASRVTQSKFTWTGSGGETWSGTVTGGATNQNLNSGYAQIGSSSSPSTKVELSTNGISGTITSIVIDCASYNGLAKVSALVNGDPFGTQNQSTPRWSNNSGGDVTFTGSASGDIIITMQNGSGGKAMYIKSITVTYTPSGTPAVSHNITYDNTVTGGTFSGPATANEGATVTIAANASSGFEFDSWNVYKTGDANTKVTVASNQFAMPTYDVTVSGSFKEKTKYDITVTNGTASLTSAYEGQEVTLSPTIPEGQIVDWNETEVSPEGLEIDHSSYKFTMPGEDVAVTFAFMNAPTYVFYEPFTGSTGTNNDFGVSTSSDGNGTPEYCNLYGPFTSTTGTIYGANNAVKLGTSKKAGNATTPTITGLESGKTYVLTFKAAPWASETAAMNVTATGGTLSGVSTANMTNRQWNDYTATFVASSTEATFTFKASEERFFLDEVMLDVAPTVEYNIYRTIKTNGENNTAGGWLGNWTNCTLPNGANGDDYVVTAPAGETVQFKAGTKNNYKIIASHVSAVDANNQEVQLNVVSSDDSGITFSFTMPASAVTITANFTDYNHPTLRLAGRFNGRSESSWITGSNGPEFTFDEDKDEYTIDVYFTGAISDNDEQVDYFYLRADDNDLKASADGNCWVAENGGTYTLGGSSNFRIYPGVYTITVTGSRKQAVITKVTPELSLNYPAGEVLSGTTISATSNLADLIAAIQAKDNGAEGEVSVKVCTDDSSFDQDEISITSDKTVYGKAWIGNLVVPTVSAAYTVRKFETVEPTYTEAFSENFGKFFADNNTIWTIYNSSCAKASAYFSGSATASESWLYSPYIDLTESSNPQLSFSHAGNYFFTDGQSHMAEDVKVMIRELSNDEWSGWTALEGVEYPEGNSFNFVDYTTSLTAYAGKTIQVAFKYTSTTERAGTWEIKNFKVADVYTITCNTADNGTITASPNPAAEGETVTITVTPESGYELATLVYNDGTDHDIKATKSFTMPAANVTVTATFTEKNINTDDFILVTDASQLVAGNEYIIVNSDRDKTVGQFNPTLTSGNFYSLDCEGNVDITTDFSTATVTGDDVTIFTIEEEDGNLYLRSGDTYYSPSTDDSYINMGKNPVSVSMNDGFVVIKGSADADRSFAYNYQNSIHYFASYKNPTPTGNQRPIYMYYRGDVTPPTPTEMTLREIILANKPGTLYKISNEEGLLGVYSQGTSVWFKDDAPEQAVDYQNPTAANYEYYTVVEPNMHINKSEGDFAQNNWIEVVFPSKKDFSNKYVRNLTGTYSCENGNPKLTLTVAVDEENDVTGVPAGALAYELNPYMAVNFTGNQTYTNSQGVTSTFFFSKPKAQEYAQILWAVWDGTKFNMPSSTDDNYYGFTGSFTISPELNAYSLDGLQNPENINKTYNFHAIIRKEASGSKAAGDVYKVYPTDLRADAPTAIGVVNVNGEVKSVKYVNVAGMVSDVPFQGVNIVVTEYSDGSRSTSKMLRK